MKKVINMVLILLLFIPIVVNATDTCPNGYDLKDGWCVKYNNAVKEYNNWVCYQGSKVQIDGETKCEIKQKPTSSEQKEESESNKQETENKEEVSCARSDNKVCVCDTSKGYELEGNWCVRYTNAFEEFNQWHCTVGTRVTKDGKEQCKQKVVPTLEEKKDEVVTIPTTPTTPTDTTVFDFCGEEGVLKTFQIVGYLITIIKILVPLILIIFGSIDFGKAVVASDDKAIQSAARMLVVRAVGGVIIFFIPAIIKAATGLIASWTDVESDFINCSDCLWSDDDCEMHICKSNPDCTWNDAEKECSCVE